MKPRALLLHGGPGLTDYLGPLADELAPVFELERYSQGRHTEVDAYLDEAESHLGAPAWIIGHSWGGYLALHLAARAPERVLGLVLVGSCGATGDGGTAAAVRRLRSRLTTEPQSFREFWPAYFQGEAPPFPAEEMRFDVEQNTLSVASMSRRLPIDDALRELNRPTLALHGTYDHIPLEAIAETLALMPDATLVVEEGLGHFPWLERPGLVHDEVVDFLASRSS
jgi:proline iminopeptidase